MPAYLNDDELFFLRERCERLEAIAGRIATAPQPADADARKLQECASSVRVLLERAEARGQVH